MESSYGFQRILRGLYVRTRSIARSKAVAPLATNGFSAPSVSDFDRFAFRSFVLRQAALLALASATARARAISAYFQSLLLVQKMMGRDTTTMDRRIRCHREVPGNRSVGETLFRNNVSGVKCFAIASSHPISLSIHPKKGGRAECEQYRLLLWLRFKHSMRAAL